MSKQLDHLNLSIWVIINETPVAEDGDNDAAWAVHKAAFDIVDKEHLALPSRIEHVPDHGGTYENEIFQLCEDDVYVEERDGKQAWSITFFASKELPLEIQKELRDHVVQAYERAAKAVGGTVRYANATIWREWKVTETTVAEGL